MALTDDVASPWQTGDLVRHEKLADRGGGVVGLQGDKVRIHFEHHGRGRLGPGPAPDTLASSPRRRQAAPRISLIRELPSLGHRLLVLRTVEALDLLRRCHPGVVDGSPKDAPAIGQPRRHRSMRLAVWRRPRL